MAQERSDLIAHRPGFSTASVGGNSSFSPATRLSHTPTTTDFQPPYFPPPYNIPQPQSQLDFHHSHVNADPYSHLNPIHPQPQHQYQLHPQQRTQHMLGRRDDADHLHLQHPGMQLPSARDYSAVRRPDVLVHGGPHGLAPEQTDLMLHHPTGLHPMDDGSVSLVFLFFLTFSRRLALFTALIHPISTLTMELQLNPRLSNMSYMCLAIKSITENHYYSGIHSSFWKRNVIETIRGNFQQTSSNYTHLSHVQTKKDIFQM
ncbi:transcription factor AP-2-beta-like isoform X3 [Lytechinus variegatus]|uniref:transcription factor AP-2-beta-like isoform X3 n=1 Tax=Lytechinus variegatus TaxID=7654 RepID=UPI001BB190A9|nr:transcription factor AP-2-beta-like isoform X3 [Lytechinus variegatus]